MSAHYNKIEFSYGGENRKCYVYDDNGNKIRLTNHNILGCFRYEFVYSKMTGYDYEVTDCDCGCLNWNYETMHNKICNIMEEINNVGYRVDTSVPSYCISIVIPYGMDTRNKYIIGGNDTKFSKNVPYPRDGFEFAFKQYYTSRYNDERRTNTKLYVICNYKKQLLLIVNGDIIQFNFCDELYDRRVNIKNKNLLHAINHILSNIDEEIVDELERVVDMYCDIVYLIKQINIVPTVMKSARK